MIPIRHLYNNNEIDFILHDNNIMVNATKMAKIFNKEVTFFLRNDNTKRFIDSCLKTENSQFLNVKSKDDLLFGKQKSGTYMHRVLALKFAAWLDPDFEVWIYTTINKIVYANYKKFRDATLEKLQIEKESKQLREEMLRKHPDEFGKFLELEGKLTRADRKRINAIKESTYELRLNFNGN